MPSPTCTVNGSPTLNGVNLTAGASVTIQLADLTGVSQWSLSCIGTDDGQVAATINASLTINSVTMTASFSLPGSACTLIFRSQVNGGKDINKRVVPGYTATFGIFVLTAEGLRLLALNQTTEGSAAYGWVVDFNAMAASIPSAGALAALTGATNLPVPSVLAERDGSAGCDFAYLQVGSGAGLFPTVGALRMAGGEALYSGDSSGDDILLIGADATTGAIQIGDNISGTGIVLTNQVVFMNGLVQFDAGAGPVSIYQVQSTTGAGHTWGNYAQQGKAGSIGGTYTIGGGPGGTLHTNLPGAVQLDLRGAVSNVGPKALFLTDAGNLSINQTTASEISITSPVGLTFAVTGTYARNVTGSETSLVTVNSFLQTNGIWDQQVYGATAGFTMTGDFYFKNASHVERLGIDVGNNNIRLLGGTGLGSGSGVITIAKATTSPTTAASAGNGILYVDQATGDLRYMGTSGVARIVAAA